MYLLIQKLIDDIDSVQFNFSGRDELDDTINKFKKLCNDIQNIVFECKINCMYNLNTLCKSKKRDCGFSVPFTTIYERMLENCRIKMPNDHFESSPSNDSLNFYFDELARNYSDGALKIPTVSIGSLIHVMVGELIEKNIDFTYVELEKCMKTIFRQLEYSEMFIDIKENYLLNYIKSINIENDLDKDQLLSMIAKYSALFKIFSVYSVANLILSNFIVTKISESANKTITEAQLNNENLDNYINELENMIEDVRKFYDEFKYKELLVPRYKKIPKMKEYVIGALNRDYNLRIPMYKVVGATDKAKSIIESEFIKPIEKIVNKYPNYILLTPDFKESSDMFIYITLREPFGEDDDRKDRIEDSKTAMTESQLSTEERNKLDDSEFGIPELRSYPLIDEAHIRSAIKLFGHADVKYRKELASNIAKKIIEKDLVGKIVINKKSINSKYFPNWMTYKNTKLEKNKNKYKITLNYNGENKNIVAGNIISESALDRYII